MGRKAISEVEEAGSLTGDGFTEEMGRKEGVPKLHHYASTSPLLTGKFPASVRHIVCMWARATKSDFVSGTVQGSPRRVSALGPQRRQQGCHCVLSGTAASMRHQGPGVRRTDRQQQKAPERPSQRPDGMTKPWRCHPCKTGYQLLG